MSKFSGTNTSYAIRPSFEAQAAAPEDLRAWNGDPTNFSRPPLPTSVKWAENLLHKVVKLKLE